jgi:hypothetical protein
VQVDHRPHVRVHHLPFDCYHSEMAHPPPCAPVRHATTNSPHANDSIPSCADRPDHVSIGWFHQVSPNQSKGQSALLRTAHPLPRLYGTHSFTSHSPTAC